MHPIHSKQAPAAIGPYSQAMVHGGIVYTSGQIPVDPATGEVVPGGIAEQTGQTIRNLCAVLSAAGAKPGNVIKTTCYLADMADFAAFNQVYEATFSHKPARSCVAVKQLPKNVLVEIEAIAVIG